MKKIIFLLIMLSSYIVASVDLTKEELEYIKSHKEIRVHNEISWAPFNFNEDGKPKGLSIDIMNLIAQKTGLRIKYISGPTWNDFIEMIQKNELDVMLNIVQNEERKKFLIFTSSYQSVPHSIVVKKNSKIIITKFEDLLDKTIAIEEGFFNHNYFAKNYPNVKLVLKKDTLGCLEAVVYGEADLTMGLLPTEAYEIQKNGLTNLKMQGLSDDNELLSPKELKIAVSKENIILKNIIDKGLSKITEEEKQAILDKWINVNVENEIDWMLLLYIFAIVIIIFIFIIWNNKKLKSKVDEKTEELSHLLKSFDKNVIASKTDKNGIITYVSEAFCEISGYKKEELIGKTHNIVRHPDMPTELFEEIWNTIKDKKTWRGEIKNRKKSGGYYWVAAIIAPECDINGKACGYSAIRTDITSKKEVEELALIEKIQLEEIQRFQSLMIGREERMFELKKLVNSLYQEQNKPLPFTLDENIEIKEDSKNEMSLKEILDIDSMQKLLDNFCNSVEIASAIIDVKGNILAASRWQKACTDFHRVGEHSCKNCIESDIDLASKLENGQEFSIYKCKNGLVDCASPIIIDGDHLANVFVGQFLIQKPDIEYFESQADKFNFEKNSYIKAINEVPIFDEKKLQDILAFLSRFTKVITELSIEKIKSKKSEILNSKTKLIALNLAEDANLAKIELLKYQEHLEEIVKERTNELHNQKNFINSVMDTQQSFVITSDGKCLRTANKAFLNFYNVTNVDEFVAKYGECICDTFDITASSEYIQKQMGDEKWIDYIYNRPSLIHKVRIQKDGLYYIFTITTDKLFFNGEEIKTAVFTDITELERTREEVEKILANILLPVLITSKEKRKILYANKYAEIQYEKQVNEIIGSNIDDIYTIKGQHYHIIEAIKNFGKVENMEETFKTATGKEFTALLSVTPISYNNEESYIGMVTDITKQKAMENEVRAIHKHTKESIEYAALIQHALIPSNDLFRNYFSDYLTIWHPKDIVGGDIYLFEELRNEDECLLMVVDCTGHGVPGAFVTMLVKAIERQVVSNIIFGNEDVSPAKILSIFNKTMKHLLKQEDENSISNAGFDGGVVYYNKKEKIIKYSGAETSLFYIENGNLKIIKGDRHSIGYKKSNANFEFKEHIIKVTEGMNFYLTTDGYIDQNGGEKGFPFGKTRFGDIITNYANESYADQQEILLNSLSEYQGDEERNDDITVIGFKI